MLKKCLAIAAVGSAALAVVATPANAAGYTPEGICGSGYKVVRYMTMSHARTYLLYNRSKAYACAVTIHTGAAYGKAAPTKVMLEQWNTETKKTDSANYKYYAGPIRMYVGSYGDCLVSGGITYAGKVESRGFTNVHKPLRCSTGNYDA
ncbi:spore-associated protein A [Actinomadura nitritigenes]|uniref:spore-associated protein A n=1 Tax=Actinomadura nitritigenes TaxID=134602 RepID=UPI003D9350E0